MNPAIPATQALIATPVPLNVEQSPLFYSKPLKPCQLTDCGMYMNPFTQAKLALTVAELAQLPHPNGLEVAFVGRSNAGKSSAINTLTNRRRLAFVAKRPGKTRTIQFYRLGPERFLVDLPGYGYAPVSDAIHDQWERLLEGYLLRRRSLVGLTLIMDSRHPLGPLDERLLGWLSPRRLPVHILLTKADKLSKTTAIATLDQVVRRLERSSGCVCSAQLFSSLRREGVELAQNVIGGWLGLSEHEFGRGNIK